jgi:hypothetical protein
MSRRFCASSSQDPPVEAVLKVLSSHRDGASRHRNEEASGIARLHVNNSASRNLNYIKLARMSRTMALTYSALAASASASAVAMTTPTHAAATALTFRVGLM